MKIAPIDIRQQKFTVKFRGFDPEEVDAFLEMVAQELEELSRENAALKQDLAKQQRDLEEYRETETNLKKTLLSAQTMKEEIAFNAKKEAELILRDARLSANEILGSSRSRAEDVADELADLLRRRKQLILNLRSILETHLRMLDMEEKEIAASDGEKREKREEAPPPGSTSSESP